MKFSVITDAATGKMSTVPAPVDNSAELVKQTRVELRAMLSGNVQFHTDEFAKRSEMVNESDKVLQYDPIAEAEVLYSIKFPVIQYNADMDTARQQLFRREACIALFKELKETDSLIKQLKIKQEYYNMGSSVSRYLESEIKHLILKKFHIKLLLNSQYGPL